MDSARSKKQLIHKSLLKWFGIFLVATAFNSCKKDKPKEDTNIPPVATGAFNLLFKNTVGDSALVLETSEYKNANGDTFTISTFNYYISNVKLIADDNSVYTESESYHLLSAFNDNTLKIPLKNVPFKKYISISFMIGVDSVKNVTGIQGGDLDPAKGMFWNWNTGYIMAKFEGYSSKSPEVDKTVLYHVGGFSGSNSVLKTVGLDFPTAMTVSETESPKLKVKADVLEWFTSPQNISFSSLYVIHAPGADAKKMADNFADMFSIITN